MNINCLVTSHFTNLHLFCVFFYDVLMFVSCHVYVSLIIDAYYREILTYPILSLLGPIPSKFEFKNGEQVIEFKTREIWTSYCNTYMQSSNYGCGVQTLTRKYFKNLVTNSQIFVWICRMILKHFCNWD